MQSDWKLACLRVLPSYVCSQAVSDWTVGGTFVSCLTLLWTYCSKPNMMHGETTSFQVCYFDSQSLNCNIQNEPISRQPSLGLKYDLVQSEGITSSYRATEKAYWRTLFHKYIHMGATATDQGGIRNIKYILFDITNYLEYILIIFSKIQQQLKPRSWVENVK